MPHNRAVIVGVGTSSSQFLVKFVRELLAGPPGHCLVATGVYAQGQDGERARRELATVLRRTGINHISPPPTRDPRANQVQVADLAAFSQRIQDQSPDSLLLIIDDNRVADAMPVFHDLEVVMHRLQMTMSAICFTTQDANQAPLQELARLATEENAITHAPILAPVLVIRQTSCLEQTVGFREQQNVLLAKSLAGIWSSPLHQVDNPSLLVQLDYLRQLREPAQPARYPFLGIAVATKGLTMSRKRFIDQVLYWFVGGTTWRISVEQAQACLVQLSRSLLNNVPACMTTLGRLDEQQMHSVPISVNAIVPFRPRAPKFADIFNRVRRELVNGTPHGRSPTMASYEQQPQPDEYALPTDATNGYAVSQMSMIPGKGVDLSKLQDFKRWKGRFYCQVCVMYPVRSSEMFTAVGNQAQTEEVG